MNDVLNELLAAEGCILDVLESYMDLCDRVLKHPELSEMYAKVAKKNWGPFLEELRKSYATHEKAIEQKE